MGCLVKEEMEIKMSVLKKKSDLRYLRLLTNVHFENRKKDDKSMATSFDSSLDSKPETR